MKRKRGCGRGRRSDEEEEDEDGGSGIMGRHLGQKSDHREQIYKDNGDDVWGRKLTTEGKSIGIMGPTLGA